MENGFPVGRSAAEAYGRDDGAILQAVADAWIGRNPARRFVMRAFSEDGIRSDRKGRYLIDFDTLHPAARAGQRAYALSVLMSGDGEPRRLAVSCRSPVRIYLNGEQAFVSGVQEENRPDITTLFEIRPKAGPNALMVECVKTASGFGCALSSRAPQWEPINVLEPFAERRGRSGWIYTPPMDESLPPAVFSLGAEARESESGIEWLPRTGFADEGEASGGAGARSGAIDLGRIFGPDAPTGSWALCWTTLPRAGLKGGADAEVSIGAAARSLTKILADGIEPVEVLTGKRIAAAVPAAGRNVAVLCAKGADGEWGFSLTATKGDVPLAFSVPLNAGGAPSPWLFLGPFTQEPEEKDVAAILADPMSPAGKGAPGLKDPFWRLDGPGLRLRPFVEAEHFGRWTYPLGVTLYGLLETGRALGCGKYVDYVSAHVGEVAGIDSYAGTDAERFGIPGANHQLLWLDALDDCGSFGSLMLESHRERPVPAIPAIAGRVARHMKEKQERRADGAFYRELPGTFAQNTIWADDLYMSIPFLVRYAALSGDRSYLDDAAKQALLYRKYLTIPGEGILSHVYSFDYGKPTGIPWGRGNGWAMFSLSELLLAMDGSHPDRPAVLDFFRSFSEALLPLQAPSGLWRQVLNRKTAYKETSCTAMFTCAFARGAMNGWYDGKEAVYAEAAERGWRGITERMIDAEGNVHGVCRGSLYSFDPTYYAERLLPRLNDPHGIGIVLLAGLAAAALQGDSGGVHRKN